MRTALSVLGMVINAVGVLGIFGGVLAYIFGNSSRGKQLLLDGFIMLVIGMILFGLGALLQRDKKEKQDLSPND